MIDVHHEGRETRVDPAVHPNLETVLRSCVPGFGAERVVVGIRIDGCALSGAQLECPAEVSVEGTREIEIDSKPIRRVALESLEGAREYSQPVENGLLEAAGLLRSGRMEEANALFADLMDALSVLVFAFSAAGAQLGAAGSRLAGAGDELRPWSEALLEAQQQSDWVLVADYLEFEIAPLVSGWRRLAGEVSHAAGEAGDVDA